MNIYMHPIMLSMIFSWALLASSDSALLVNLEPKIDILSHYKISKNLKQFAASEKLSTDATNLEELIKNSDVHKTDSKGRTLLHEAALYGLVSIIELLLTKGAAIDLQDYEGFTPLHLTVRMISPQLEALKKLISSGASVHVSDFQSRTPLHTAVHYGHSACVNEIIAAKADCNALSESRQTPLHDAATGNHLECAQLLLANKANPNIRSHEGETPLHEAARWGYAEFLNELIAHKADVSIENLNGQTALHCASFVDIEHVQVYDTFVTSVLILLQAGADPTKSDNFGRTALHEAASTGCPKIIRVLVERGAPLEAQNNQGSTALTLAKHLKKKESIAELEALALEKNKPVHVKAIEEPNAAPVATLDELASSDRNPEPLKKRKKKKPSENKERDDSAHSETFVATSKKAQKKNISVRGHDKSTQSEFKAGIQTSNKLVLKSEKPSHNPLRAVVQERLKFSSDEASDEGSISKGDSVESPLEKGSVVNERAASKKAIIDLLAEDKRTKVNKNSNLYTAAKQGNIEWFKHLLSLCYIEFKPTKEEIQGAQERLRSSKHTDADRAILLLQQLSQRGEGNSVLYQNALDTAQDYILYRLTLLLSVLQDEVTFTGKEKSYFNPDTAKTTFAEDIKRYLQLRIQSMQEASTN